MTLIILMFRKNILQFKFVQTSAANSLKVSPFTVLLQYLDA